MLLEESLMDKRQTLEKIARRLRIHSVTMTSTAGSGHPTTCLSIAEVMACLFFGEMRLNISDPFDWSNDEFVLSKGHAAPILWAAYAEAGILPVKDLKDLRKLTSPLEGHPTPRVNWVKAATGSLGQGLSVGVGMAKAMKIAGVNRRVYVIMGDGECAEGAVWEAASAGSDLKLNNLCAFVDINRLGQSDPTLHGHDLAAFDRKFKAFGWNTVRINGHSIPQILKALDAARASDRPTAVLSKTFKGKGISFAEDKNGWHGKPFIAGDKDRALSELGPMPDIKSAGFVKKARPVKGPDFTGRTAFKRNSYAKGAATRRAYGNALVRLGEVNPRVVVLDGDVKNSTYADDFFRAFPERSIQLYIAEQNMVGLAIGLSAKGFWPYLATFAAFLSRAHDQIRMAAYSQANIKVVGSHVGVSIGEDGPSQMGLEDIAIFRPIPQSVILYPSDAYAAEGCLESLARHRGISYLRTSRPAMPLLYSRADKFPVGGSKVLKKQKGDKACVIAAGVTVHEALAAYQTLKQEGITISLIDAYSVKPLDRGTILQEAQAVGGRIVVVEDHFAEGGLGDAVAAALAGQAKMVHLAVRESPRSGKPNELLEKYGISTDHIVTAVKSIL